MPQLDPNTFIYQYIGVVFLLIVIYTILSYVVLPTLLRLMLIRNNFLTTRQTSTELVSIVSTNYQQLVSFKNPTRSLSLLDNVVINVSLTLNGWLTLINTTLSSTAINHNSKAVLNLYTLVTTSVIDYFILFLLIELDTNE